MRRIAQVACRLGRRLRTVCARVGHSASFRAGVRLSLEPLEPRALLSGFRSFDGSGNNLLHPDWGKAGTQLLRVAPAAYGDGVSTPAGAERPSARAISNAVVTETEEVLNDRNLSDFIYVFGQMIDHDLDLSLTASGQPFPIAVPTGDPFFDPASTGTQVIFMNRSRSDPTTGIGVGNPRQQVNEVTSWLDGSVIYGSSEARARALRTLEGGRLKTSAGNLLPFNTMGLDNQNQSPLPPEQLFVAGDRRVNENIELTAMQTVFLREHNRLAGLIQRDNPRLNDEEIYQRARQLVVAELQQITYEEYLPALLGRNALRPYAGYRSQVNPGISNEFAHAAFRMGHTLLGDDVEFLNDVGEEIREELPLNEAFFNPGVVQETGIEPILKYLATDKAREVDTVIVNSVRNFLFGPPGAGGFDLAALDIQRGRDHGLADYNTMRVAYGLPAVASFAQITSNSQVQQQLRDLYGNVNNIDVFIGGLAEDLVPGASVGPLFQRIIARQFEQIRDGDRFWYERDSSLRSPRTGGRTTLADLLRRTTTITNIQGNAFFFEVNVRGRVFLDSNGNGLLNRQEQGLLFVAVQLLNAANEVIAATRTAQDGSYAFVGLIDGPGEYTIRLVPPYPGTLTSPPTLSMHVTRGEEYGFNFGVLSRPMPRPSDRPGAGDPFRLGMRNGAANSDAFWSDVSVWLDDSERAKGGGWSR